MIQQRNADQLREMLFYGRRIIHRLPKLSQQRFQEDEEFRAAMTHWLMLVGEAASKLSPAFIEAHRGLPWHQARGLRNRIVHDSFGIDEQVVFHTLAHHVKPLLDEVDRILREEAPPGTLD